MMNQRIKQIFSVLEQLVTPRLTPYTPEWYRGRLTMVAAGTVLLFYFLPELVRHLIFPLDPVSWLEALIILSGTVVLLLGFLIAKQGHVNLAVWLTLVGWTADLFLDVLVGEGMQLGATLQVWLTLGLMIAFLLLSLPEYLGFSLLQTGLIWLTAWLRYENVPGVRIDFEIYLIAVTLLGLGSWLRSWQERKREEVQQALQKQKEYLQKVIDGIQSPFYVIDARNYHIRLANQAARQIGLLEERTTCYALTHHRTEPCSGKEHPCPLQHVRLERKPYATEHIHFRPDGSTYYAEVHAYPLFDETGQVVEMIEYSLDVTERKLAEAEIRKLQRAVEHAASGVIITDAEGVIQYVNPMFEQMTGYSREEIIGQTPRVLKSGKLSDEFYADLWRTIRQGQVWQGEMINRRKDGSLYWELQTIAPVLSPEGNITHFIGIKLDISRQKELEQQLVEAKEIAEAASAFKSRLLANVSHDMRTPLGAILGYAELLREEAYGEVNDMQRQALDVIAQSAQRLANLISGMLTRAELESGRLRLQKRMFVPADLLKALVSYRTLAERKNLTFKEEIDASLPARLYGDPYWLEQILTNLTDNAIKYTQQGSVWVRLKCIDEQHWGIEVQDTGIGIPEDKRAEIFQPFVQLENTSDQRKQGVGLGLSIVRDLVERLGGKLELESAPGVGSIFRVILPIEELPYVA